MAEGALGDSKPQSDMKKIHWGQSSSIKQSLNLQKIWLDNEQSFQDEPSSEAKWVSINDLLLNLKCPRKSLEPQQMHGDNNLFKIVLTPTLDLR